MRYLKMRLKLRENIRGLNNIVLYCNKLINFTFSYISDIIDICLIMHCELINTNNIVTLLRNKNE